MGLIGSLEVKCEESNYIQNISVSIPEGMGLIEIKDIKQEDNILKINYVFNSSKFVGESVDIQIWLSDENETNLKSIVDNFSINKEGLIERNVEMQLPENLGGGLYSLYFAFSSDASNFIKKPVVLGVTGRAVLDSEKGKFWVYILFLLIIGVAIFFIWRRSDKADKTDSNKVPKHHWLLRKKDERIKNVNSKKMIGIVILFALPLMFILGMSNNLTGFAINNSGSINKSILSATIFFFAASATLLILQKRKSPELFAGKYPYLTNLSNKQVYTKEGEALGNIEDITIGDCKIENIRISFNHKNKKKFHKKGILIRYKLISKIGEIVILKDFELGLKEPDK